MTPPDTQTGLVVLPFLPGDSLLFVAGTLAAIPQLHLSVLVLWYILVIAAIAGDAVNYWVGHNLGPAIFRWDGDALPVGGCRCRKDRVHVLASRSHVT